MDNSDTACMFCGEKHEAGKPETYCEQARKEWDAVSAWMNSIFKEAIDVQ